MMVVIDYGIGNTGSVVNALTKLGIKNRISDDPSVIKKATGLILPGVGAAGVGMENLKKRNLVRLLCDEIESGKPFLGICLGMQLLFDKSEEGDVSCLGVFEGSVKKFQEKKKVPQIGWNEVQYQRSIRQLADKDQKLFYDIPDKSFFYFVNSYYCCPLDVTISIGESEYGETFASVVAKNNVVGVQFHPEKSGKAGFQLLQNFYKNYAD